VNEVLEENSSGYFGEEGEEERSVAFSHDGREFKVMRTVKGKEDRSRRLILSYEIERYMVC